MSASSPAADRNLLFGILAVQMDFISRDALIQACTTWVLEKEKPLGQILQENGALRDDTRPLLEAVVQKHLEMHEGAAEKSMASVAAPGPQFLEDLHRITDPTLQATPAGPGGPGSPDIPETRGESAKGWEGSPA
jgi:hypothetical protein